jgi:excinuclease ABC subunit C
MVVSDDVDADIFGLAHDSLVAAAHVFRVRGGRVLSAKGFVVETPEDETASSLVELLLRDGFDDGPPARIVVVPELPGALQAWEEQLTALRREAGESGGVKLKTARRGELAQLEQTVTLNAAQTLQGYLSARTSDPSARSRALAEIQNALDLPEAPLRLECFDVSHLGGDNPVASMVVFEDGLARREHYRRFAITDARDDTEAIYQVVSRRLQRLLAPADDSESSRGFSYPPGLIVVDGGLPQVNAAQRALDELGVSIPVCGLAKKLEEVWRAHDDFPVILPRNSEALFLLQRARDEAHRVAIRYQRSTRKRTLRSELLDIPGLGTVSVAKILKHFGSVAKVKQASIDEITHVPGVGAVVAEKIHTFLQQR